MDPLELELFKNLGIIVITAAVFSHLGRLIQLPSIVSYIIAGVVLGPGLLHLVHVDHSLELLSEAGIALLLFLVGLEMSVDKLRSTGKSVLILGVLQVGITGVGGAALALAWGFSPTESLFFAGVAAFSSTAVVIKLLDQKGAMKRLYARLMVGLLLIQDVVVIVVLTLLTGFGGSGEEGAAAMAMQVLKAVGGMSVLLGITLLAARFVLPKPMAWASRSPETILVWALCWCFILVWLASAFGLSLEIGAFLAGLALAQLPVHEDLHRRLHPLMNFFIAVFLAILGIHFDPGGAMTGLGAALLLSGFVLVVKPLLVFIILARMKYSEATAFNCALASGQSSEFAFILLSLGVSLGMIEPRIASIGALTGIITIAISSYLVVNSEAVYALLRKLRVLALFRARQEPELEHSGERRDHIIVVGMNTMGRRIVRSLCARGENVLAVDTDPQKLAGLDAETVIGNVEYGTVVEEIGLPRAKLVVSALQIENVNHLLAYRCGALGVQCAIHAFDPDVVDDLLDLNVNYLIMPSAVSAVRQREMMHEEGVL